MRINRYFSGYCPTIKSEKYIEITYQEIRSLGQSRSEYIQVGADCDLASYDKCPVKSECPIRARAPKNYTE